MEIGNRVRVIGRGYRDDIWVDRMDETIGRTGEVTTVYPRDRSVLVAFHDPFDCYFYQFDSLEVVA